MKLLGGLLIAILITGCGNFFESKTPARGLDPNGNASGSFVTLSFEDIKTQIFEPYCLRCHSNYQNFISVKRIAGSILSAVEQNRMPKNAPPLNEDLKILLRTWVAEGANEFIENETSGDSSQETDSENSVDEDPFELKPTWESLSLNIFEPKCLICHNPKGQAPWIDFSSRAAMARTLIKHLDFKTPENSNLIMVLTDPAFPMPPLPPESTISQLTEDEVLVVLEWINLGLP